MKIYNTEYIRHYRVMLKIFHSNANFTNKFSILIPNNSSFFIDRETRNFCSVQEYTRYTLLFLIFNVNTNHSSDPERRGIYIYISICVYIYYMYNIMYIYIVQAFVAISTTFR